MVLRYDARTVGQLLSDEDKPVALADVLISDELFTLLMDASGEVESACVVGNRYVIDPTTVPPTNDLAALTGASQQRLKRLVCDICMFYLWTRRPLRDPKPLPAPVEMAYAYLDKLRSGEALFGLKENINASLIQDYLETAQDVQDRYLTAVIARRMFGTRGNQIWRGTIFNGGPNGGWW
jgi:hypothetical protein